MNIRELIEKINYYTEKYDEGKPQISDQEWDELYFELKEFEDNYGTIYPDSPTQTIKYEFKNELEKISHTHPMLSLDKTKSWEDFLQYFEDGRDVIGMLKLDGCTCSLEYNNGILVRAETRGDGTIGENILHNAKVIKTIPQTIPYKKRLVVDGEIICTEKDFKPFSKEYQNSRNFASGSIRLLDAKECAKRNLTFIVWNIVEGFYETNSFLTKLIATEKLGFTITPWTSSWDWDAKEFLIDEAKRLGYPIDGLVGRFENIKYGESLGSTGHHSKAAFAFKFHDEEFETTLLDIEWSMGRNGILTPIAVFEPVDDGISIIERASLHNISVMKELFKTDIYRNEKIIVAKMNQIIPQVIRIESSNRPENAEIIQIIDVCPVCGESVTIIKSDSGTETLYCPNINCEGKLVNQLEHYCGKKGLDIKGLSKKTLEKLIEWEWVDSITSLYSLRMHAAEWKNKTGFGETSVEKILTAIDTASKEVPLESFISALGIPLIGKTNSKELVKYISTYPDFRKKIDTKFDFSEYEGFAENKVKSLLNFDYSEFDNLIENGFVTINESHFEKEYDAHWSDEEENLLKDITFVITGSLKYYKNRQELVDIIERYGGKVSSSVSKKTNYLINNDSESDSSKNKKAKELKIPIINEEKFNLTFLKNCDIIEP